MTLRHRTKDVMLSVARRLRLNSGLRTLARKRLVVLCYHAVVPDDHPVDRCRMRVATRVSDFTQQMATVQRLLTPVSATEVLDHVAHGTDLPSHPVLITFDDGFRNNLVYAAPVMERFGIPALIHVSTGHIGETQLLWTQELDERIIAWKAAKLPMPDGRRDAELPVETKSKWQLADEVRGICKRLPNAERLAYLSRLQQEPLSVKEILNRDLYSFLSWDEVRQLDARGHSIGAHTVSHPILTRLTMEELRRELVESKSRIEMELGKDCPWLAYPNGSAEDFSPQVVGAVKDAGYEIAFTLLGRNNPDLRRPLEIDRVCIPGELSADAFDARLNGWLTYFSPR